MKANICSAHVHTWSFILDLSILEDPNVCCSEQILIFLQETESFLQIFLLKVCVKNPKWKRPNFNHKLIYYYEWHLYTIRVSGFPIHQSASLANYQMYETTKRVVWPTLSWLRVDLISSQLKYQWVICINDI